MDNIKITGIKKALRERKNWLSQDRFRVTTIMLDKSTGEVWVDCFIDCNTWGEYHSNDIISLSRYIRERTDEPFTAQLLEKYADMVMSEND